MNLQPDMLSSDPDQQGKCMEEIREVWRQGLPVHFIIILITKIIMVTTIYIYMYICIYVYTQIELK